MVNKIILKLASRNIIKISDKNFIKEKYKLKTGKELDFNNIHTFNEKMQWLKLYDKNPKYTQIVDKYEVKDYLKNKIGEEYIIRTIGIYNYFDEINFDKLPNQFVIKCTHDSGSTVICTDKNKFSIKKTKKFINKCLKKNHYFAGREWPYKNVVPRIIIEEFVKDNYEDDLHDYKFWCFNGKVKYIHVTSNRDKADGIKVDFYDLDWNKQPIVWCYPNSNLDIEKPKNYEKMKRIAEKLSENFPFVRVDMYEVNGKVLIGELTLYPGAGFAKFYTEKYDEIFGDMLSLPDLKLNNMYNYKKERKNEEVEYY